MSSDIEVTAKSVRTVVSSEQEVLGLGERGDEETTLTVTSDDPFVSVFVGVGVGSDIVVTTESSGTIVGGEEEVVLVDSRLEGIDVVADTGDDDSVSVFLVGVGSDIEVTAQSSGTVIRGEQVVVGVRLNSDGNSLSGRSVEEAIDDPGVSGFLVSMSSDIEITTITVGAVVGSEQVVVGLSRDSDVETTVGRFNDPFVSFFVGRSVGSDVVVTTESSSTIVGSEQVVVGVGGRSNSEEIVTDIGEDNFVSLFLRSVSSDIEVTVESSNTVVGGEQVVIGVSLRSDGNLDFDTVVTRLVLLTVTVVTVLVVMELLEHLLEAFLALFIYCI